MKRYTLIINFLLTFGFTALFAHQDIPVPNNGVLDLRESVLDSQTIINLNGEWQFHWQKLLTPGSFDKNVTSGIPVVVPSYWSSYKIDGRSLPGTGYGTYSLMVILPEDFSSLICFDIPVFDVAYKFYLNDRMVSQNGEVGTSMEEEKPLYEPESFCFNVPADTLQILIQVSNFHHRRGGFWKPVVLGSPDKVLRRIERQRIYDYSTIGVLFFFMLFFIIFWSLSRKEITMLLFALTTLGILIRAVNTGTYLANFFIDAPWSWQIRMEYLGSYLGEIFGIIFLHKLFPLSYMKRIIQANTILMTLMSISLIILPVHIFAYEMLGYQPLLVLFLTQYLVISMIGTVKGKIKDIIFFVTLSFFIFTLINDILLANSGGTNSGIYLTQISFQLFIFAMAVMIILQWIRNDRKRIQLESSLRFKNRVLSVIAHDLKNPVASVAQFSDLLVTKPELASRKHVILSLRESSHAAVTLLDNLLYWGRNESDRLQINPVGIEIGVLAKELESLYSHMATQKEIAYSIQVEPGIRAFADPVLVTIVIRNLVGNAIKFTHIKGSVQFRCWQESDKIYCSVSDTGIGIKTELLEQFQKEGAMKSSTGTDQEIGTGLGLQLVKELIEKNNGSLEIKSEPGVGSTFTFTLPAYKPD
jgi:two-component system, sensor histidine kinase